MHLNNDISQTTNHRKMILHLHKHIINHGNKMIPFYVKGQNAIASKSDISQIIDNRELILICIPKIVKCDLDFQGQG